MVRRSMYGADRSMMDLITINQIAASMSMEGLTANASTLTRQMLMNRSPDDRRNLNRECGYPDVITPEMYHDQFVRNPYAERVVNCLPSESWQVQPEVYETEDENPSPFEDRWEQIASELSGGAGQYKGELGSPVWEALLNVDILSGVGHYGVLLIGIDDKRKLNEPVDFMEKFDGISEETPPPVTDRRVLFLRPFPQKLAQVIEVENNIYSPRFGQPKRYNITFNDPYDVDNLGGGQGGVLGVQTATAEVHWTRVLHVADNTKSSPVFGAPRMSSVFDYVLDLRKIHGASGEGYWLAAINGLAFSTHPQLGGDVEIDQASMRNQMENYYNGLQKYLLLSGLTPQQLTSMVADPTPHIQAKIEAICIKLQIPKRIFMGTERGELASSQDDGSWNDKVRARQNNYITPKLIVPFVDRLMRMGCIPVPKYGYKVDWPDLESQTSLEKAQVSAQKMQALSTFISGGCDTMLHPKDFYVTEWDKTPEEAEELLENAQEWQSEKQELQADIQETGVEAGVIPDPEEEMELKMEAAKHGVPPQQGPPGAGGGGKPPFGGPPKPGGGKPPFKPKGGSLAKNEEKVFKSKEQREAFFGKLDKIMDGPGKSLTKETEKTEGGRRSSSGPRSAKPDVSGMDLLGEGASRKVYDAGDGTVVKVPKGRDARRDNKAEMEASGKNDLLARVVDGAKDGSWIRQERLEKVTPADLAKSYGVSAADQGRRYEVTIKDPWGFPVKTTGDWMLAAVHAADGRERASNLGRSVDKFIEDLKRLKATVPGLDLRDLAYAPQWGRSADGRVKVADFSLTENVRSVSENAFCPTGLEGEEEDLDDDSEEET